MNEEGWLKQLSLAYASAGRSLSSTDRAVLVSSVEETPAEIQKKVFVESTEHMRRYFFEKASKEAQKPANVAHCKTTRINNG